MALSVKTLELFSSLDWPDAPERKYVTLRCFGCYREYRGPRTECYCWACTKVLLNKEV